MLNVRTVSIVLLAGALFLRVWVAWDGVAVCIWDDSMYREQALRSPLTLPQAIGWIMIPTTRNYIADKTMGYHLWMVMGLRAFGWLGTPAYTYGCSVSTTERAWQVVNIILLVIQLACVYGVARWGLQDRTLALAVTTSYLLCPIVFGMNRWVLTENHVMAALWVGIAMTLLVIANRQTFVPVLAAVGIGMFATVREYAVPLLIAIALVGTVALVRDRRYVSASAFISITSAYLGCAVIAAGPAFALARMKLLDPVSQGAYWNPLPAWFAHMVMESWGPSLTGALVIGGCWVAVRGIRRMRPTGLTLLWWSCGALTASTLALACLSVNRLVRPSIPPFIFACAFVLLGVRVTGVPVAAVRHRLTAMLVCVLLASAVLLADHLFVRFDHGKSYIPHAAFMEYYDHPLWIRPIGGQYDRHFY